jgi:hypothetical protein
MVVVVEFTAAAGACFVEAEEGYFVEFVAGFIFFDTFFYRFEVGLAGEFAVFTGEAAGAGLAPEGVGAGPIGAWTAFHFVGVPPVRLSRYSWGTALLHIMWQAGQMSCRLPAKPAGGADLTAI